MSSLAWRSPASSSAGVKLHIVVDGRRRRHARQAGDARKHRRQHSLAVDLAERDEPQSRADQQRRRRVEERRRRRLGVDAARPSAAPNTAAW